MMERLTDEQLTAELDGRIALRDSYIKHGYHGTAAAYDATIMALTELKEWRMAAPQLPQPAVAEKAITQHFDTLALDVAKMVMCDVNRRHEFLGGDVQLLSRIQCRIDDAYRAAMLQGAEPVSQPYTLPNEINCKQAYCMMRSTSLAGCYRDGWNDCRTVMLEAAQQQETK